MSCEVKSKMHSEHHVYFSTKKSKDFNCIFEIPSKHGFCINGATHVRTIPIFCTNNTSQFHDQTYQIKSNWINWINCVVHYIPWWLSMTFWFMKLKFSHLNCEPPKNCASRIILSESIIHGKNVEWKSIKIWLLLDIFGLTISVLWKWNNII